MQVWGPADRARKPCCCGYLGVISPLLFSFFIIFFYYNLFWEKSAIGTMPTTHKNTKQIRHLWRLCLCLLYIAIIYAYDIGTVPTLLHYLCSRYLYNMYYIGMHNNFIPAMSFNFVLNISAVLISVYNIVLLYVHTYQPKYNLHSIGTQLAISYYYTKSPKNIYRGISTRVLWIVDILFNIYCMIIWYRYFPSFGQNLKYRYNRVPINYIII